VPLRVTLWFPVLHYDFNTVLHYTTVVRCTALHYSFPHYTMISYVTILPVLQLRYSSMPCDVIISCVTLWFPVLHYNFNTVLHYTTGARHVTLQFPMLHYDFPAALRYSFPRYITTSILCCAMLQWHAMLHYSFPHYTTISLLHYTTASYATLRFPCCTMP